jgi:hypothetical protein
MATSSRPTSLAMASKVRFFFFLASKRVGEDAGRRGMIDACTDGQWRLMGYVVSRLTSKVAICLPAILER